EPMLGALGQLPPAPGTIGEDGQPQTGTGQGWGTRRVGWGQDDGDNFEIDPSVEYPGNYGNNTPGGVNMNSTGGGGPNVSQGNSASSGGAGSYTPPPSQGQTSGNPTNALTAVQLANSKLAQQKIDQDNQRIQNDIDKENNRHAEELAKAKSTEE